MEISLAARLYNKALYGAYATATNIEIGVKKISSKGKEKLSSFKKNSAKAKSSASAEKEKTVEVEEVKDTSNSTEKESTVEAETVDFKEVQPEGKNHEPEAEATEKETEKKAASPEEQFNTAGPDFSAFQEKPAGQSSGKTENDGGLKEVTEESLNEAIQKIKKNTNADNKH